MNYWSTGSKLDHAFAHMTKLIDEGMEYPEAHTRAVMKEKLSFGQAYDLRDRYDEWCVAGCPAKAVA